jgi:hypothetical protein
LQAARVVGQERAVHQIGQALLAGEGLGQDALAAQVLLLAFGELVGVLADEFLGQFNFGHCRRFLSLPSSRTTPLCRARDLASENYV